MSMAAGGATTVVVAARARARARKMTMTMTSSSRRRRRTRRRRDYSGLMTSLSLSLILLPMMIISLVAVAVGVGVVVGVCDRGVQAFTTLTTTTTATMRRPLLGAIMAGGPGGGPSSRPRTRLSLLLPPPPRDDDDGPRARRTISSFPSVSSSSSSFSSTTTAATSTRLSSITYRVEDDGSINNTDDDDDGNSNSNSNYGEESRAYRRTIYTHEDWKRHRDPSRFFKRARTMFRSGIYWNIRLPVRFVTCVSLFVVVWNAFLFQNFQLSLPLQPFTLSSASLGLLLVFRTNTGYGRWDEARKCWGMNINRTRDLMRMAVGWYDESYINNGQQAPSPSSSSNSSRRQEDLTALALATWAFVRCMKRHLSPDDDEVSFRHEILDKLPKQQADAILQADHRPNRALFDLSVAIENLPMHFLRKNQMHESLTKFEDNLGSSERLLSSPVPLFYSRHLQRFLLCWLSTLPFAMYEVFCGKAHLWINRFMLIPVTVLISTFMFGIDELANQMEEPFTILPQQQFCDRIFKWCMEMVDWKPGDNGTRLNHYGQSLLSSSRLSCRTTDLPVLGGDSDFAP